MKYLVENDFWEKELKKYFGIKEGARSELYYTAQIAVTCFQIIVQLSPVLSLHSYWL